MNFSDTKVQFHNNFDFYSKISTQHQDNSLKNINHNGKLKNIYTIKQFTIELIPDKKQDIGHIKIDAYGYPNEKKSKYSSPPKQQKDHIELTTDQIKHEITNSLNVINMSNILINSSFKNPELEKYTAIISNELKNTANILNCSNSVMVEKEVITVQDFYNYMNKYLDTIDNIYNITSDGIIEFEPLPTGLLNCNYLNINPAWFKIILDNIFKNIYGHIGDTYSLLLKMFAVYYNPDLNTLCIDIINKKSNIVGQNLNKCHLYKQITDKYDLTIHSQMSNTVQIKPSNSQGLKLIHILCEKQNITWQLLEFTDDEYIFKLGIPLYDNYNIKSCHVSNTISQIGDKSKISNLYLNEALKETVI
jgi:two-component sensor histidine kinase